jgi:hypothetical protein
VQSLSPKSPSWGSGVCEGEVETGFSQVAKMERKGGKEALAEVGRVGVGREEESL